MNSINATYNNALLRSMADQSSMPYGAVGAAGVSAWSARNTPNPVPTPDFEPPTRITHPSNKITSIERTFIVDSRERNTALYPYPSHYRINMPTDYKNVSAIELKGGVIPRSSYNLHSTNKYIDFSMGSTITAITILDGGAGYTSVPTVTITPPTLSGGTQATATATVNLTTGVVTGVVITDAGSGYSAAAPPTITLRNNGIWPTREARLVATVGTLYTAAMRECQITLGGNAASTGSAGLGLVQEIQDAMNYAYNGAPYVSGSLEPFEVRLVSQYPTLGAVAGTPEAAPTNGCPFNRIQITNTATGDAANWQLLFSSGPNAKLSAVNLMGFNRMDYQSVATTAVGGLIDAGQTIRGDHDPDLLADPLYCIVSFSEGRVDMTRVDSENSSINRTFATMVFDANPPNVLTDLSGTTENIDNVEYLTGALTKGTFWTPPGITKAIRGFDFDRKLLQINGGAGKLASIEINFSKFSTLQDGRPEYYGFQARDHLLIFGFTQADQAGM